MRSLMSFCLSLLVFCLLPLTCLLRESELDCTFRASYNEWRGWVVGANLKAEDRNLWHVADFWRAIPVCLVWRRGGLFMHELTPGPWHSQNESLARQFSSINSPCGPQTISPSPPNAVKSVIWSHRWKRLTSSWSSRPSGENQLTRSHEPHLAALSLYTFSEQTFFTQVASLSQQQKSPSVPVVVKLSLQTKCASLAVFLGSARG